eukprot:scaffold187559_cov23-Prasinocladus_malaysianus.AAC.1
MHSTACVMPQGAPIEGYTLEPSLRFGRKKFYRPSGASMSKCTRWERAPENAQSTPPTGLNYHQCTWS